MASCTLPHPHVLIMVPCFIWGGASCLLRYRVSYGVVSLLLTTVPCFTWGGAPCLLVRYHVSAPHESVTLPVTWIAPKPKVGVHNGGIPHRFVRQWGSLLATPKPPNPAAYKQYPKPQTLQPTSNTLNPQTLQPTMALVDTGHVVIAV